MGDFIPYYLKQQVGFDANIDTRAAPGPRPTLICLWLKSETTYL